MTSSTRRLRQLTRAASVIVAVAVLIIGVPALLIVSVGNPFPATVPSVDEIRVVLTQSGDGFAEFVQSGLAVLIWFLWIQFVLALLVEVVATLRKRPTPHLPTVPGIQGFAARLIASITLAATLAATSFAPTIGALSFDDLSPVVAGQASTATSTRSGLAVDWTSSNDSSGADVGTSATVDAPAHRVTLASHTELWDLAEAAYGDGTGWKVIVTANVGALASDGATIGADTQALPSGTSITIPGAVDLDAVHALNAAPASPAVSNIAAAAGGGSDAQSSAVTHTVVPGESMWSIAQERVGSASPANELNNYWHAMVGENDDVPSGDVDLIHPGDQLRLPPLASDEASGLHVADGLPLSSNWTDEPAPENPDKVEFTEDPVSVEASTEVEDLVSDEESTAVEELGEEPVAVEELTAVEEPAVAEDSVSVEDPTVAEDSVSVEDPTVGEEPVSVDETSSDDELVMELDQAVGFVGSEPSPLAGAAGATLTPDRSTTPIPADHQVSGSVANSERVAATPTIVAGLGAALIAAGVVGALRRRRALQWRMRTPATLPLQPSTQAAAFEAVLAHAAAQVSESELGNNWQALPLSALDPVHAAAQVHAYADGRLRVVSLDNAAPDGDKGNDGIGDQASGVIDLRQDDATADNQFADADIDIDTDTEPEITVWRADGTSSTSAADSTASEDSASERSSVSLVVGTDLSDGSAVLIDLAAGSTVDLEGEHHEVCRFARSVVIDLATSDRSTDVQVIMVGHSAEAIDLERVLIVDSYRDAVQAVQQSGHAGGTSGTPVVIVATNTQDAADATGDDHDSEDRNAALAQLRSLGAIVAAPAIPTADVQLAISSSQVTVWPTGTTASTAALPDHGYRLVSELVEATSLAAVEPTGIRQSNLDVPQVDGCSIEPGPVEVRVLGPVEIIGATSFSSTKAIDVVTYLAFHRNGVDADQLKTWVWPSFEPPTDKAFANVLSRARTGLGVNDDDSPYLSRAGADRTYRLDAAVTTDFDRFRGLVDLADQCVDQRHELDMLGQALELIRGVPFTGGTTTSFVWADNHVRAHVEFAIDEAVHRCADLALELGEVATARWAALKGLELVPGCEQCFRRRFLVASAANNRQELRRAMADLERTTAAELGEPEAVDLISRDLVALFDELDRTLMSGAS